MPVEDIAEVAHQTADDLLDIAQIIDGIEVGFLLLRPVDKGQQLLQYRIRLSRQLRDFQAGLHKLLGRHAVAFVQLTQHILKNQLLHVRGFGRDELIDRHQIGDVRGIGVHIVLGDLIDLKQVQNTAVAVQIDDLAADSERRIGKLARHVDYSDVISAAGSVSEQLFQESRFALAHHARSDKVVGGADIVGLEQIEQYSAVLSVRQGVAEIGAVLIVKRGVMERIAAAQRRGGHRLAVAFAQHVLALDRRGLQLGAPLILHFVEIDRSKPVL